MSYYQQEIVMALTRGLLFLACLVQLSSQLQATHWLVPADRIRGVCIMCSTNQLQLLPIILLDDGGMHV